MPYFDHNATSPLLPCARATWLSAVDETWYNPASPYRAAARAHLALEDARERLATLFGCAPARIVFDSGATEGANAVVAWGAARATRENACIRVSTTEHPAVLESARALTGRRFRPIVVSGDGGVDARALAHAVAAEPTSLVAIMAANNETGVLADLDGIAGACREAGVAWLCDASQWIGRMPVRDLPRDAFIVGSAHKFGGPRGVGFLVVPEIAEGFVAAIGGGQEGGHRAGTPDVVGVLAMVAALEWCETHDAAARERRAGWRDACAQALVDGGIRDACVHGAGAPRLWNTLSLALPPYDAARWVARLDRLGFEVSTGSACATGSDGPSHVLAAMGVSTLRARATVRVSSDWRTTEDDWRALAEGFAATWTQLESEREGSGSGSMVVAIPPV
ncbi:cysteine desulfurase family protein [Opitutales bacterium ASA1]|uniref:cysteine desulfurase family protein n=1 Tax=Congregicoccus parvus TaxID=3081749 RepID=UPI002B280019|nr:cysteine desulfurase family protein [Opitutales bacterium ASA1]